MRANRSEAPLSPHAAEGRALAYILPVAKRARNKAAIVRARVAITCCARVRICAFPEMAGTMRLSRYVKFREERFGGVLFETRSERVFTLNASAAAVVREVQTGCDEGEIARRLRDRFDDPSGAIEREVAALIAELRQKGLVEDSPRG